MTRVVRAVAWAPVFVMVAWVLSVVEHADVGIEPAVRTMVVAVLAALVVSIACTMLLRDVPRGGAIATLVVMGLLAGRSLAVWAAVLAAIVLILVERWRARSVRLLPWPRIHEAVTILTLVLMILGGVRVGMQLAGHPVIAFDPAWAAQVPADAPKPNIYLLLVDGRGRSDVLDSYGYDSSPFIDRLTEMDFRVAQQRRANYAATRFTLASMLAGSHLDQLGMDLSHAGGRAVRVRSDPADSAMAPAGAGRLPDHRDPVGLGPPADAWSRRVPRRWEPYRIRDERPGRDRTRGPCPDHRHGLVG